LAYEYHKFVYSKYSMCDIICDVITGCTWCCVR